jgi:hypothetical protein
MGVENPGLEIWRAFCLSAVVKNEPGAGEAAHGTRQVRGVGEWGKDMMRIVAGLAAAVCVPIGVLAVCLPLGVADGRTLEPRARSLPMQFEWHEEGPAELCGSSCRSFISAVGTITADTPRDFDRFLRGGRDPHGALLVLDSGGGSVHGAMALGRRIRELGMSTTVGRTLPLDGEPGAFGRRAKLVPNADCESMCAFVLLAGATREVPAEARVMVHQIWLGDRRDDAVAAAYSAQDLALVQRDIGRLALYTAEMGGAIELLDLSLRNPPWEPMRALSRDELRRTRLISGEAAPRADEPASKATTSTAAAAVSNGPSRRPGAARSWFTTEETAPALARRHPLTVDGEEIGGFELRFACGPRAGMVDVRYSEWRRASGSSAPLREVTLAVAGSLEPLRLTRSHAGAANELRSVAEASLPAAFLQRFAAVPRRTISISTVTADGMRTTTRVGDAGLAAAYEWFNTRCAASAQHASAH